MTGLRRHPIMWSTCETGAAQPSGMRHPQFIPDSLLLEQLAKCLCGTLKLTGRVGKQRGENGRMGRVVELRCEKCGKVKWALTNNIRAGHSHCLCQKGKYYDKRAECLGQRYDSMVQRCRRGTHVSSENYKGRGIRVCFRSREHFIRWAL